MNEIWKDIDGYEGLYQVSNYGKVKSLGNEFSRKEKILNFSKNKDGYLQVFLYKEGKRKNCYVHCLVANAFIPNPNNLPTVNHINENKENNVVENLEWMNMKQQVNHGTCQQRRAEKIDWKSVGRKNAEKLSKQVYQYSKDGTLVAIYPSVAECGRNGFNQGNVAACCRGELKHYKNYIWSYEEINQK